MLKIYKSIEGNITNIQEIDDGSWVNVVNPTDAEIKKLIKELSIEEDFFKTALDNEERPHIEREENQLLIVFDVPIHNTLKGTFCYETIPITMILTPTAIVTIAMEEHFIFDYFISNKISGFNTFMKYRFVLLLLYKNAELYLMYLRKISKEADEIENVLKKSLKNKELLQLMELEKGLVYFSTSLRANGIVLERLLRNNNIKKYEDDKEILEDTIIENKQAIEMSKVYSDILSGTMDAYASIISNNVNNVMKILTLITIVMALPTIISSLFGMNVGGIPFAESQHGFLIVTSLSVAICTIVIFFLFKKKIM